MPVLICNGCTCIVHCGVWPSAISVNYPGLKIQQQRFKAHASEALNMSATLQAGKSRDLIRELPKGQIANQTMKKN